MSKFLTKLRLERGDKKEWKLSDSFVYESTLAGRMFLIPKGFETDLASVPRLPLAYLFFDGVADEAAVVHDWLYSTGELDRELCDDVFFEAMEVMTVPAWRKWPVWAAVRVGGWVFYKKGAKDGNGN